MNYAGPAAGYVTTSIYARNLLVNNVSIAFGNGVTLNDLLGGSGCAYVSLAGATGVQTSTQSVSAFAWSIQTPSSSPTMHPSSTTISSNSPSFSASCTSLAPSRGIYIPALFIGGSNFTAFQSSYLYGLVGEQGLCCDLSVFFCCCILKSSHVGA